jgi:CBS domain-containing protein
MITVKNLLAQKAQGEIRHVVATDSVLKVLELMKEHTIRSVVVLDDAGNLHPSATVRSRSCSTISRQPIPKSATS